MCLLSQLVPNVACTSNVTKPLQLFLTVLQKLSTEVEKLETHLVRLTNDIDDLRQKPWSYHFLKPRQSLENTLFFVFENI